MSSSAASNSDARASLSRRSRTRTRSKTVSASSSPAPDVTSFQPSPYPAAFSRPHGVRDSVLTHDSGFTGASSSIYPPSTSTASGTDSPPSPRSLVDQLDNNDVSSFDPELEHEYDGDDVSYRLRLLVKNNYFLPPAHAKPSPSDLAASDSLKRAAKPPSPPTFFDLFRRARSKSRSKPSTPTGGTQQAFDLRTSSDPAVLSPQEPRGLTLSQTPRPPGRVVVVRERMPDIATAAKQAEQEMKARVPAVREASSSPADVIDPTDAVDLPPPSAAYPFAVQASALHEMGVQDSVGAAALADRLPPPHSPGGISVDGDWRRDLLRAAVDYSLNSTDALVSPRHKSTSLASPTMTDSSVGRMLPPRPPRSPNRPTSPGVNIGQRIVSPPLDQDSYSACTSRAEDDIETEEAPRTSSTIPVRVETPSMPLTPLAPPPRKVVNPLYSISQTSLPMGQVSAPATDHPLESTPRLSDSYEAGVRHAMLSPPLIRPDECLARTSLDSDATSFYSDEVDDINIVRSSSSRERPSFSVSAQPSPTQSAFHDALNQPPVVTRPPRTSSLRGSLDHPSCPSPGPIPRDSMASPPTQSTLEILAPPPTTPPFPTIVGSSETTEIHASPPSSPPFSLSKHRGASPLSLAIPRHHAEAGPRSAPPAASFFDSIQSQPNAMDDLDSSDEDDSDEGGDTSQLPAPVYTNQRTRAISSIPPASSNSSSRSLLMRLGNNSTPYVSQSGEGHSQPVSNVPKLNAFFTQRRGTRGGKSDQGHGPPTSTFDFYQYAQQQKSTSPTAEAGFSRRPQTAPRATNPREQESLRRLDGMLIQHMEAERASIRRIATNLSTNAKRMQ
ncbi:hypothetical protein C8F01DRAFT_1170640 [Mycena amicta]|nr:hypothetical protein C8F01DRAFT_1170640 [Mycena amicta]